MHTCTLQLEHTHILVRCALVCGVRGLVRHLYQQQLSSLYEERKTTPAQDSSQLHMGSMPMWACEYVCVCIHDVRNSRLFTDNLTQLRISLHFLDWIFVLCTRPSWPHLLLCLGISQYLITHYIQPVTHQYTFLCMCVRHMFWKCGHSSPFV